MVTHDSPAVCVKCGDPFAAGHICYPHNYHCEVRRAREIHDACDSLVESNVPPDVVDPLREYADSLGGCTCG